jgi:hypothetical protein
MHTAHPRSNYPSSKYFVWVLVAPIVACAVYATWIVVPVVVSQVVPVVVRAVTTSN